MDSGVNLQRGFRCPLLLLQPQLADINQPKWRVATDVLHVIITTSVAVNRTLKTTGRDCTDVHSRVRRGNVKGDVPLGFFLKPQYNLSFKRNTGVFYPRVGINTTFGQHQRRLCSKPSQHLIGEDAWVYWVQLGLKAQSCHFYLGITQYHEDVF